MTATQEQEQTAAAVNTKAKKRERDDELHVIAKVMALVDELEDHGSKLRALEYVRQRVVEEAVGTKVEEVVALKQEISDKQRAMAQASVLRGAVAGQSPVQSQVVGNY